MLRLDGPSIRTKHLPESDLVTDDQDVHGDRRVSGKQAAEFPEPTPSDPPGPVEASLARALQLAAEAQRWEAVTQLARELEARRLARMPNVVSMEDHSGSARRLSAKGSRVR